MGKITRRYPPKNTWVAETSADLQPLIDAAGAAYAASGILQEVLAGAGLDLTGYARETGVRVGPIVNPEIIGYVAEGEDPQAKISQLAPDAVVQEAAILISAVPTTGNWFRIRMTGWPGNSSDQVYEFTAGSPTIPGAVAVPLTMDPFTIEPIINAAQGAALTCTPAGSGSDTVDFILLGGAVLYTGMVLTKSSSVMELHFIKMSRAGTTDIEIRLGPGTFTLPISLPDHVHLKGTRGLTKITNTVSFASNTSARDIDVETGIAAPPTFATPFNLMGRNLENILITHCFGKCLNWTVQGGGGAGSTLENLRVVENELIGMNPIYIGSTLIGCKVIGNLCGGKDAASQCFAFFDDVITGNGSLANRYNVIANNTVFIGRQTGNGVPYVIHLAGHGNIISNNTVYQCGPALEAPGTALVNVFISVTGGYNLTGTGESVAYPNLIVGNRLVEWPAAGATATSWKLLVGAAAAGNKLPSVILAGNSFILSPLSTNVTRTLFNYNQTDAGSPPVIYVYPGGVNGFESMATVLVNASVSWRADHNVRPPVSVADVHDTTPTDAELDGAFGTPAALGEGFVGLVNDADGGVNNYICWTSDGKWVFLKGTVAT